MYNTICEIKSLFLQQDLAFVYKTLSYNIIFLNIEYEYSEI
jgi:hypothetical protein